MESEKNLAHATSAQTPEELVAVKEWWKKHGDRLSTIVLVVLVAIIGYQFYERRVSGKDANASLAYSHAMSVDELENVIATYKSSAVAPLAQIRLASEYYQTQQYDLALEAYEKFLRQYPKHPFAVIAQLGKAHAIEAQGNFAEAE